MNDYNVVEQRNNKSPIKYDEEPFFLTTRALAHFPTLFLFFASFAPFARNIFLKWFCRQWFCR